MRLRHSQCSFNVDLQERQDAEATSTSSASSASAAEVLRAGARLSVVCPIEQHLIMDHSYASSLPKWRHVEEEFLDAAHEVRLLRLARPCTRRLQ